MENAAKRSEGLSKFSIIGYKIMQIAEGNDGDWS